jgi:hypothetical protein
MPQYLCTGCGVAYGASEAPPDACLVCGRHDWITPGELRTGYANELHQEAPGITGMVTEPPFALGQRALLVRSAAGNVLWNCLSLIDSATVAAVQECGGVAAIAISHPRFGGSMAEWSRAFGGAPVYIHAAMRQLVAEPDPGLVFWSGEKQLIGSGFTMLWCGESMLHWAAGAGGRGALLAHAAGLDSATLATVLAPYRFEHLHGAFPGENVFENARDTLLASASGHSGQGGGGAMLSC